VLLDAGKINHWNSLFSHGAVPVGAQPIGVSGASDQKIVHRKKSGSYARAAASVTRGNMQPECDPNARALNYRRKS
jgi:hypothetical protein